MPYNPQTDARIKKHFSGKRNMESKRMFGGVGYLFRENMFCRVYKDFLVLRLGEPEAKEALRSAHIVPFDITGKPMKGWVMVQEKGFRTDDELSVWLDKAMDFAKTLPPK